MFFRLESKGAKTEASLEEELTDRDRFASQSEDVLKDLETLLAKLTELVQSIGPELKDVEDKMISVVQAECLEESVKLPLCALQE